MAAQPLLATVLIGMGVDSLSMIPRAIPKIKYLARSLNEAEAIKLAKRCLNLESGGKVRKEIEDYFKEYIPTEFSHKGRAPLAEA